ncbi:prorelaxin-like [Hypanus sabinus]|uniref:prorelaxin-like n=1 Tax=Hypanus sabinus TaxID=79690 RepID=UPI0028C49F15|nr:prorelaxin-like [Hypanus sabinus]
MRHQLCVLSIGLLLTNSQVSASTARENPDAVFKVCNKDFLNKVMEICGGWVQKSEIPDAPAPSQETPDMMELKKMMMDLVKNGIQRIESYERRLFFHNVENQDEQLAVNISKTAQGRVLLLRDPIQRKLTRRAVTLSDKCCNTGCKYQELAILCEP